jgi:ribonuclease P protein component
MPSPLPVDQRFLSKYRLRSGAEFRQVYDQGRSAADGNLVVYVVGNSLEHPRLGLSVSRKVGGAVQRNRWKRLIREAFRLYRLELPMSVDLVVIPRGGEPALEQIAASLVSLARQAQRRLGKPRPPRRSGS